ncbi:MAG TPA: dual specificity protein phosphatase family protein [Coleofasciculaceae cyanobacterium]
MKYALIFIIFGIFYLILGLNFPSLAALFFWFSISFMTVGAAYGGLGAKVFGKKSNGSLSSWSLCLLMPYLCLTWVIWYIQRWLSSEDCCNRIAPGIWLGRRPLAHELPKTINLIIDLTAEFRELPSVISDTTYICVPTLDTSVPPNGVVQNLIHTICHWQGDVYIHCALGHGRSATVAAAVLLAKGLVDNVDEAETYLKKLRPGIQFSQAQRSLLQRMSFEL